MQLSHMAVGDVAHQSVQFYHDNTIPGANNYHDYVANCRLQHIIHIQVDRAALISSRVTVGLLNLSDHILKSFRAKATPMIFLYPVHFPSATSKPRTYFDTVSHS